MIRTVTYVLATVLTIILTVAPSLAASGDVIWGRQTALGKFETKKVNLPRVATITAVNTQWDPPSFCIKSGQQYPQNVVCWNKGDQSLVGSTLPAGNGYFAVPAKRTNNSPSYVQITVKY